jgi:hypothetical protein
VCGEVLEFENHLRQWNNDDGILLIQEMGYDPIRISRNQCNGNRQWNLNFTNVTCNGEDNVNISFKIDNSSDGSTLSVLFNNESTEFTVSMKGSHCETHIDADPSGENLLISFDRQKYNGWSEDTQFIYTLSLFDKILSNTTTNDSSHLFQDNIILPGENYEVQVAAVNACGQYCILGHVNHTMMCKS